ncbi:hypothetical protein AB0M46_46710 [Dactylosporangium sp. NPDC051485]|uniref:hypothetical protein n=1 Tax=Dactylosporangium sp. NPDC051485 TaxID=3154846 RepID=UPI003440B41B
MRVTFIRFADHEWGYVTIARDDGVVYRMNTGPITGATPHDLVHYTVEDALRIPDGIWGSIAGGVVFRSMHHVSGRRPPHAAERSKELIREHRELLRRAEHIGGLCERAAALPETDLARFAAREPSMPLTAGQLGTAAAALRAAHERWSALAVGETLELQWPRYRSIRTAAGTPAPTGRPERSRSRRGRSTGRPTPSAR